MVRVEDCLNNEEVCVVLFFSESAPFTVHGAHGVEADMGGAKCDHHVGCV